MGQTVLLLLKKWIFRIFTLKWDPKSLSGPLAALAFLVSDRKRTHFWRCMQLKFILLKLPSIGAPCTDDGGGDESIENVVV